MTESQASGTLLRRALVTIQHLQQRVDQLDSARRASVAVLGVGLRLPGNAVDFESFWDLLTGDDDGFTELSPARWPSDYFDARPQRPGRTVGRRAGLIDLDTFDHEFFGIDPVLAASMDPQQRLVLDCAWEAVEHARMSPSALAGSPVGVFVAACTNDFATEKARLAEPVTAGLSLGVAHSAIAGWVSNALDLRGPAMVVDSACASSLTAIHSAVQSLRVGDCDLALVGGVNVMMSPLTSVAFSQAGRLSPTNSCKPFDIAADGPVNSEGAVVLVLKRASDAERDGDPILGVILGSAINHNGRGASLTAPSVAAQIALIQRALSDAGIRPGDVDHVEAHASSTILGDLMEAEALQAIYGGSGHRITVGSVKGHVGHLQAAGGLAGLVKVLLALRHDSLPATAHLTQPNPEILESAPDLTLLKGRQTWPRLDRRRIGAVSAFGFTGTNAHVLVGEGAPVSPFGAATPADVQILPVSASSPGALAALRESYAALLDSTSDDDFADVCFAAATTRAHLGLRVAVVAGSGQEAATLLRAQGRRPVRTGHVKASAGVEPMVGLVLPGKARLAWPPAPRWTAIPAFMEAIEEVSMAGVAVLGHPVHRDGDWAVSVPEIVGRPDLSQISLFGTEYAIARSLLSAGVQVGAVYGVGAGAHAAAVLAGMLSVHDAVRSLAVLATSSGLATVSHGLMVPELAAPAGGEAHLAELADLALAAPVRTIVSAANGAVWPWQVKPDAPSWVELVTSTKCPADQALAALGCSHLITVADPGSTPATVPPPWSAWLSELADLYVAGAQMTFEALEPPGRRRGIDLPIYPFESRCNGPKPPRPR